MLSVTGHPPGYKRAAGCRPYIFVGNGSFGALRLLRMTDGASEMPRPTGVKCGKSFPYYQSTPGLLSVERISRTFRLPKTVFL